MFDLLFAAISETTTPGGFEASKPGNPNGAMFVEADPISGNPQFGGGQFGNGWGATSPQAEAVPVVDEASMQAAADTTPVSNANDPADATDPLTGMSLTQNLPPAGDLDATEADELLYMREEEKLARDVYLTLYETWGLPVFRNIANSEERHTSAVLQLLDRYNLDDPAATQDIGQFSDPSLQQLYDDLVSRGLQSLEDALAVGATIEEVDIVDLQEAIANTDNADIEWVYSNLMRGSENHLRAFTSTLTRQTGETYSPEYLSSEEYDSILNSGSGRGQGQGRGQGRGRRW